VILLDRRKQATTTSKKEQQKASENDSSGEVEREGEREEKKYRENRSIDRREKNISCSLNRSAGIYLRSIDSRSSNENVRSCCFLVVLIKDRNDSNDLVDNDDV
jgi:hypothetical protein